MTHLRTHVVLGIALCALSWSASADDVVWVEPFGGDFLDANNWDPNFPLTTDRAVFGEPIGSLSNYTVNFPAATVTTKFVSVRDDNITFDLGGGVYDTTGGSFLFAMPGSIAVGEFDGDIANLTLTNGTLRGNLHASLGYEHGATGFLTVDSGGILELGHELRVGFQGTGALFVENGGSLFTAGGAIADLQYFDPNTQTLLPSSGVAVISGPGSSWISTRDFTVGTGGNGTLLIEDGGHLSSGHVDIWSTPGLTATATITDPGSTWTVTGTLFSIGFIDNGELFIENGAVVEHVNAFPGNHASSYIRGEEGDGSFVTVDGVGTQWMVADTDPDNQLVLGDRGTGNLDAQNFAAVSSPNVLIGSTFGGPLAVPGTGIINVSSSATLAADQLIVANRGSTGDLNVTSGGQVTAEEVAVGFLANFGNMPGHGTITVDGSGSELTATEGIVVGSQASNGTLVVSDGGLVSTPWLGTSALFNFANNARGDVTVTGAGSRIDVHTTAANPLATSGEFHIAGADAISGDIFGTFGNESGGESLVLVENGGSITVANLIKLWQEAELRVTTGSVTVGTGPEETAPGTVRVHADATLAGIGRVTAPTLALDGTLTAGTSTGELTLDGTLDASDTSLIVVELASIADHDHLDVSGTAHLDGTLQVDLLNSFLPTVGDLFDVISYSGVTGAFENYAGLDVALDTFLLPLILPDRVRLQTVLAGDANLDGVVDALDANIISLNFLAVGLGYAAGDVNLDGVIDSLDANIVSANFLNGQNALAANPIPEPSALFLALTALATMSCTSRNRRRRTRTYSW